MAHALYPIKQKGKNKLDTLYFTRRDKERANPQFLINEADRIKTFDWQLLFTKRDVKILRLFNRFHQSYKIQKIFSSNILFKLYYFYISYIINKAIRLFAEYQTIITSRLHGHILACLMDKENGLIDNSYGKNSGYYECWTNSVEGVYLIKEPLKSIGDKEIL